MARSDLPPLPLIGGCNCGAVRYEITGAPLTVFACHCTTCQPQTGSAFALSLRLKPKDLRVNEGEVEEVETRTDSGSKETMAFCPDCHTRLWHYPEGKPNISLKAGTLDDTSWLKPVGHLWTRSKQPWVRLPEDDLVFETQPESLDALIEAFRNS